MHLGRLVPYGISRCIYSNSRSTRLEGPLEPTEVDHTISSALGIPEVYAVPLTFLASESDLVIVLAPGGKETFHIVDEGFLRRMKKTAVLINVARGSLVDTGALVRVLKEGVIHGAGLDVIEGEPNISLDHPLLHEPR
jgi:lactate dehydrogenase-like 2-hydroxyacid dehydrogenase